MKQTTYILILLVFLLNSCCRVPETIKDVTELKQNHLAYWNASMQPKDLLSPETQARQNDDYNIIFFSVWHQKEPFYALPERINKDFLKYNVNLGYGENKKRHTRTWIKQLRQNAALADYPNVRYPAITVRNSSVRVLPTIRPHFSSPAGDSMGWPFDNWQRSAVAANTPVFVCHLSADKAWALIETDFTYGWIEVEDVASVTPDFVREWERGRYAVIIKDKISITDKQGNYILKASLGYIFPLIAETTEKMEILTAVANENSEAVIKRGFVAREAAAVKPLRFNSTNVVRIANELVGEPYGWGGLYGNRDCSSMTRDFFSVFGIWLPRHSEDQVKEVGSYVDLQGLSPEQKEKTILEKAVPYLTLIWRRGHIMLYIGPHNGRALVFHNIWGIKTRDLQGREGRKIIGQAVITTLQPGQELRYRDPKGGDLLTYTSGMSILAAEQ